MLYPIARGQYAYAGWLNDGGNVLMVGDSITLNLGPSIVSGRVNIDGIGSGYGSNGVNSNAQWTAANDYTYNVLAGYNLFGFMATATFNNGTSPNQTAWNSQVFGTINSGHFWAGSGGHNHHFEMMSLQQAWLKETLATNNVVVKIPFYMGPDGVTTNDIRFVYRGAGLTELASSPYFNTYRATNQVVWVSFLVPAMALPDGYSFGFYIEYRPNVATRAGEKAKWFSSQITIRETRRSNGIVFMTSGIGGANSADFSNQGISTRNVSSACINAMLDGLDATHFIGMIGQNSTGDLATYKSQMGTMLDGIDPTVKKILISSFGTVANTGGEVGSSTWCQGADELARSRNDLLHLNVQRLAPDVTKLYYAKTAAYATAPNGTPIRMGDIFTDSGNTYVAKFYGTKTASTPALNVTTSWANIGSLTNTQAIGFEASTDMYLGDATHPSYPLGMECYRANIQAAHQVAANLVGSVVSTANPRFKGNVYPGEHIERQFHRRVSYVDLSAGYSVKIYHNDALLSPQPSITLTASLDTLGYEFIVPSNLVDGGLEVKLATAQGDIKAVHEYDVEHNPNFTVAPGILLQERRDDYQLNIDCYVSEAIQITRYVFDSNDPPQPIDLSDMTLQIVIETKSKLNVATIDQDDITIVGSDHNGFQFNLPSAVTAEARTLECSLRNLDDGNRVWGRGAINVRYAPVAQE